MRLFEYESRQVLAPREGVPLPITATPAPELETREIAERIGRTGSDQSQLLGHAPGTWAARPTGRCGRRRWRAPIGPSGRIISLSLSGPFGAARPWSATRATPGASSPSASRKDLDVAVPRPPRRDESDSGVRLPFIRQRIESVFWTCKDVRTLERHGARTLANLRARIATRLLTLAACITLNHQLGRPSRALVALRGVRAWNQSSRVAPA